MLTYSKQEDSKGKEAMTLLLGPILGLVYVITLPFIAIATMATLVGRKLFGAILGMVGSFVSFGWRPSEAHLAGKKKNKKK